MKLAIVHYHLKQGGVAQVIRDQLRGLALLGADEAPEQVAVLSGDRLDSWAQDLRQHGLSFDVTIREVDGLDYDDRDRQPQPAELAARLIATLTSLGFAADDTVVHVHNHSLGKNTSLPGALRILAERGYRLLLQLHDFAEDFRPRDYRRLRSALRARTADDLGAALYPQSDHVHYAVLNHRDHSILRAAGVAVGRLHVLANPVIERSRPVDRRIARARLAERCGVAQDRRYVLYPARGIRRKNLGEALLWAAMFGESAHVGLTLPAVDPTEREGYERWRAFAHRLRLPCTFETGASSGMTIEENFAAADCVLTTSVAEGFGLVFLEGYLGGRRLMGRDLPEVTKDFVNEGVTFPGLRDRIDVPLDWVGRRQLIEMLHRTYNWTLESYSHRGVARSALDAMLASKVERCSVDFGDLDASTQERVVESLVDDRRRRHQLIDTNPWMLDAFIGGSSDEDDVETNAETVRARYSCRRSADRVASVYGQLMSSRRDGVIEPIPRGGAILDEFLRFDRFRAVLA